MPGVIIGGLVLLAFCTSSWASMIGSAVVGLVAYIGWHATLSRRLRDAAEELRSGVDADRRTAHLFMGKGALTAASEQAWLKNKFGLIPSEMGLKLYVESCGTELDAIDRMLAEQLQLAQSSASAFAIVAAVSPLTAIVVAVAYAVLWVPVAERLSAAQVSEPSYTAPDGLIGATPAGLIGDARTGLVRAARRRWRRTPALASGRGLLP